MGAAVLMLGTAWLPLTGTLSGDELRVLATLAAGCLLIGSFAVGRVPRPAFSLLWASLGASLALGIIGIFSTGGLYLISGLLFLMAIMATPNRSELQSRFDRRYVVIEAVVFISLIGTVVI